MCGRDHTEATSTTPKSFPQTRGQNPTAGYSSWPNRYPCGQKAVRACAGAPRAETRSELVLLRARADLARKARRVHGAHTWRQRGATTAFLKSERVHQTLDSFTSSRWERTMRSRPHGADLVARRGAAVVVLPAGEVSVARLPRSECSIHTTASIQRTVNGQNLNSR